MTPLPLTQGSKNAKNSHSRAPLRLGCGHVTQAVCPSGHQPPTLDRVHNVKKEERVQVPRGTGHIVVGGVKGPRLGMVVVSAAGARCY